MRQGGYGTGPENHLPIHMEMSAGFQRCEQVTFGIEPDQIQGAGGILYAADQTPRVVTCVSLREVGQLANETLPGVRSSFGDTVYRPAVFVTVR